MRAHGIDVSTWQGVMDWDTASQAGAQFAFIRAGSVNNNTGILYTDTQWATNAAEAPLRMLCGGYWYFRPNHSAVAQAMYFGELYNAADMALPPVVDCETAGGLNQTQLAAAIQEMVQEVYAQTGEAAMIYTRGLWWNDNVGDVPWAGDLDLWVARYNQYIAGPWADGNYRPLPWSDWRFWQYSADGNGQGEKYGAESNSIDLNWFNGDYDDLLAYADIQSEPTLEERVTELERIVANVRDAWMD